MSAAGAEEATSKVPRLVLLVALFGVAAGGAVLAAVGARLRAVESHYEQFNQARAGVADTLRDLRNYRLDLMQGLSDLRLRSSLPGAANAGTVPPRPFDQVRVDQGADRLRDCLSRFAVDDAGEDAAIASLQSGLRETHRALSDAWDASTLAATIETRCAQLQDAARAELATLARLVQKEVGRHRLQVAKQLIRARGDEAVVDAAALDDYTETYRTGRSLYQLRDDLHELVVDVEKMFGLRDADNLRSHKDNRLRLTLGRLRQNSYRLRGNADEFRTRLQQLEESLFGSGVRDDLAHQMLVTSDDGLYVQELRQIAQAETLRETQRQAEQISRSCRNAEERVGATVSRLHAQASEMDAVMIRGVSHTLIGFAAVASVLFGVASAWVYALVKRSIQQSTETQREALELARIIRESPTEIYVCDRGSLRYLQVSEGARTNLGYRQEELLGLSPGDLSPDLAPEAMPALLGPLYDGTARRVELRTEHRRSDGSTYPVQVAVSLATFKEQSVYVLFATDLTEMRRLEEQLGRSQKLESLGQLSAGIAHEINTPMQFVSSNAEFLEMAMERLFAVYDCFTELLLNDQPLDWQTRRDQLEEIKKRHRVDRILNQIPAALEESREGIGRVVGILNAMKSFSHPGGQQRKPINLNEAVESTITITRNRWKYTAELETELDPELPAAPAFAAELNQVLLNLVVNASDAVRERFGETTLGKITVRTRRAGDMVEVEVEDNGCGIPEAIRRRVFDPFFTTKEVGKGTGQGLAITHNVVVNMHGGRVNVKSAPEQGAVFTVSLPIEPNDAPGFEHDTNPVELAAAGEAANETTTTAT
ncbi:Blue-light-activated protein [Posidoniimonas polymericola]|uniref:histidine kinase n=1 Tax=Posidoniimonas polymericola TaxID=2528002 RepID=A0A5C5YQS5_9BACT|nr:ATP-binding protein [Posidoniimonas polymericola]TWT77284.1 Blue-light-activated protein [Posidoniimonas polymericola]